MDMGVSVIVFALVGAAAGYFFGSFGANKKVASLIDELDAAKRDVKKSSKAAKKKSKSSAEKGDAQRSNKDLKEARSEIKKLKKQVYDLKEAKKSQPKTEKKTKSKKSKKQEEDVVFSLREEIGELKAELAVTETRAKIAEKASKSSLKEDFEPEVVNPNDSDEVVEIKKTHREELKALRSKAAEQEREFKKKVKKTSSNVDKQRRRADNNDKAYKITQRQVDGLQERIAQLEKELRSAKKADPVVLKEEPPAAQTTELAVHATTSLIAESEATPEPESIPEPANSLTGEETVPVHNPLEEEAAPGFIMTKEAEPNTIEISEDMADDLIAEADRSDVFEETNGEPERQTMRLDTGDVRSTQPLGKIDPDAAIQQVGRGGAGPGEQVPNDEEDDSGNTAILSPSALADMNLSDSQSEASEASEADDETGNTQLLTPQALADAGLAPKTNGEDPQPKATPRLGDDASSIDDAWADFDVD